MKLLKRKINTLCETRTSTVDYRTSRVNCTTSKDKSQAVLPNGGGWEQHVLIAQVRAEQPHPGTAGPPPSVSPSSRAKLAYTRRLGPQSGPDIWVKDLKTSMLFCFLSAAAMRVRLHNISLELKREKRETSSNNCQSTSLCESLAEQNRRI